jgi:amino acid transporter
MLTQFSYDALLVNLAIAALTITLPLYYLRPAIRTVLLNVCSGDASGADFWLRAVNVLAFSGTLALVLIFTRPETASIAESMRLTLLCTLIGIFITVLIVTTSVWRIAVVPYLEATTYSGRDIADTLAMKDTANTQTAPNAKPSPIEFR